jgi:hypothetical protein
MVLLEYLEDVYLVGLQAFSGLHCNDVFPINSSSLLSSHGPTGTLVPATSIVALGRGPVDPGESSGRWRCA